MWPNSMPTGTSAKEVRLPCEVAVGCAVDLGLGDAGLAAVHVRFDAMRSGKIGVSSRLEDQSGRASAPQAATLALDSSGFGASHYDAGAAAPPGVTLGAVDGKIIMVAVRVPGWLAPSAVPGCFARSRAVRPDLKSQGPGSAGGRRTAAIASSIA